MILLKGGQHLLMKSKINNKEKESDICCPKHLDLVWNLHALRELNN
jgi:hypothetical protein